MLVIETIKDNFFPIFMRNIFGVSLTIFFEFSSKRTLQDFYDDGTFTVEIFQWQSSTSKRKSIESREGLISCSIYREIEISSRHFISIEIQNHSIMIFSLTKFLVTQIFSVFFCVSDNLRISKILFLLEYQINLRTSTNLSLSSIQQTQDETAHSNFNLRKEFWSGELP